MSKYYKGMNTKQLMEHRHDLKMRYKDYCKDNPEDWTASERRTSDVMLEGIADLTLEIERRQKGNLNNITSSKTGQRLFDDPMEHPGSKKYLGVDDRPNGYFVLDRSEKLTDKVECSNIPHPCGEAIRFLVCGLNSQFSIPEVKADLVESGTSGYLLPETYTAGIIDLARAQSVLIGAGVQTVVMNGPEVKFAKVTADPTFKVYQELQEISKSDPTFGALIFTARKIATMILVSRELAADSPNFGALIEATMFKALAVALDNIGLNGAEVALGGDNSYQITGLNVDADVAETGSIGALSWSELSAAATAIRARNHEPNAAILNTSIRDGLMLSADSTGQWILPPSTLQGVGMLATTNQPTAKGIVGQFNEAAWAIRQRPEIEVTTTGGDKTFEKHGVLVKITWIGDFGLLRPAAFQRLAGIS